MSNERESIQDDPFLEAYEYESMFGPAEVFTIETEDGEPLRCLYVDGGFQTATFFGERRFEPPFAYCKAFDVAFAGAGANSDGDNPAHALLIGGGAFSFPKHALTAHGKLSMDVVEIDPAIIDIARKHFFADELERLCGNRLRVFAEDGMEFLRSAQGSRYDAIINDSFAGTVIDAPLLSPEGLALTKGALASDGLYLLNAVVDDGEYDEETGMLVEPPEALGELARIRAALESAFDNVACNDVEDEEFLGCINHVFVASDGPLPQ